MASSGEFVDREPEAPLQVFAIDRETVDLAGVVGSPNVPARCAPRRGEADVDDRVLASAPLALNTQQSMTYIDDQVVAAAFGDRPIDIEAQLDSLGCDARFGDCTFAAVGEHDRTLVRLSDGRRQNHA
jgi:hypothetical protein